VMFDGMVDLWHGACEISLRYRMSFIVGLMLIAVVSLLYNSMYKTLKRRKRYEITPL